MRKKVCGALFAITLTAGLLAATPASVAQMRGGSMGAPPTQPGMPQNNPQPNSPMGMQNNAEADFLGNMRRNIKVETDLSKMALKNSSNDDVKKFAAQVISENRRNEMQLTSATSSNPNLSGVPYAEDTPSQTRQAEKQMKKLTGTQFDGMYLAQMNGYVKNDQSATANASGNANSSDLNAVMMQLRNTADDRIKQIAQVAQSENFKLQ